MVSGQAFLPHLTRGYSHVCVTAGSRFIIYYLSFLHLFFRMYSILSSSNCKNQQQQLRLKRDGTLICIQNLGSGPVCWYLCFSVWEFLLAAVNIRGLQIWSVHDDHFCNLLQNWRLCTQRAGVFYSCGVQRCSCASGDDAEWITKVPNPLGLNEPHTSLRPGQLPEAWCFLVWNLQ